MTTDIATPVQMPFRIYARPPASSAVVYHPAAEPDAELHIAVRAAAIRVTGRAMPVRECGCCGAAIGRMMPSEVNCPRAHRG
jgi:hypothetical protein